MIGRGKIGQNACIGPLTTIFHTSIDPMSIIAPGSIIGDPSRPLLAETLAGLEPEADREIPPSPPRQTKVERPGETASPEPQVEVTPTYSPAGADFAKKSSPVVGQIYVNQLLLTLFPERGSFKNESERQK